MTDALGVPNLDRTESPVTKEDAEVPAGLKKLAVMSPPSSREPRPVTNLGKVFGQFAELQQQIAEQVVSLEDSVHHQRQDIASAVAQLPELRERINWLIASFYEQSKKDESVRERLNRHDATLAALLEASRTMQETQGRWQSAIDEVVTSLLKAKAMLAAPEAAAKG
jgi:septal ring factor EnvC (AmiA/AmiB activator)